MRAWIVAIVVVFALGACGSDDSKASSATTGSTIAGSPSSSAPPDTSTGPTTTGPITTGPIATGPTTVVTTALTEAPTTTINTTDLVDGKVYWGYVAGFKAGTPALFTIDVSEVYFGQQAIAEATKDHTEGTIDPDVDPVMYVRNNSEKTRTFPVKPGVQAVLDGCDYGDGTKSGDVGGDCKLAKKADLSKVPVADGEDAGALVIFVLEGGQIRRIEQPYFP